MIDALKSSRRVAESFGYLYLPLILIVELHVGVGLYRAIMKWTSFNRKVGSAIKWVLTAAFLVIGYAVLATFWSYGLG